MSFSFEPLGPGHRRAVALSALRIAVVTAILVAVYAATPVAGRTGAGALARLAIGVVVFSVVLVLQLRSVRTAVYPHLRAAEALAVAFVVVVLGFSFAYLSLSHGTPRSFSQHLDRVSAVYFALSVITTVGFGDIAARTDPARIVVIVQFLGDIGLIFGVVRLFIGTAQRVYGQRTSGPTE
jgi:hypothetical protein